MVRLIDVAVVRRIGGLIGDAAEAADFHVQLGADDASPIIEQVEYNIGNFV